jgi:hypothetical protein
MAKLTSKLGEWELPFVHMWKDREVDIRFTPQPLISSQTQIATMGSCFAQEIADAMERLGLNGAMHPSGLFYNTKSILQELENIYENQIETAPEEFWKTEAGYLHPFKSYKKPFSTTQELEEWSSSLDRRSKELFQNPDIIVLTLGLIEAWRDKKTGLYYRQIPHPEVFPELDLEFRRLTVSDMLGDLQRIRDLIRKYTNAKVIVTVSPVPLHSTMTHLDVRVANSESKSRIRAAVSEFVEEWDDVYYFHSYDVVTTAERLSDFMMNDGRHVHRHSVDYILREFLRIFAKADVKIPKVNTQWLTPPLKTLARPSKPQKSLIGKIKDKGHKILKG